MNVTSKISVDLALPNTGTLVNAVQGDGNTRSVEISLLSDGRPWTPPEGVEVAVAYQHLWREAKGLYNKLADGTAAISITGNVATVILAPQMLTASGTVQASLVFNDAQLNRLTTFPFSVSVASNPAAGAQKVEDYLRLQWLEDKLEEYLAAIKASGVFDGKPGDNGVTFTPSVSENGDLSWRNNGGLPNPKTVNIRGQQGDSTAATAAANAAQTSAANAASHAADAATSAAAAQAAADAMGTELSHIKQDLADKLPKSPANWEPWTAEEQAAARERMGITRDYELIEEITVEEDLQVIERSYDLDGNMYEFRSILLISNFPKIAEGRDKIVNYRVSAKLNNNKYIEAFTTYGLNAFKNSTYQLIQNQNGFYNMVFSECTSNKGHLSGYPAKISSSFELGDYIKSIRIETTLSLNIYSGSIIKIYGVRA